MNKFNSIIILVIVIFLTFGVGYIFGQTIQVFLVHKMNLNWIWGYGPALATFGLFLGIPQWRIFHRHMRHTGLWILFSITGWMLTGMAWVKFGVNSGVDSIIYGIVTGLGLVWLVHSQPSQREKIEV